MEFRDREWRSSLWILRFLDSPAARSTLGQHRDDDIARVEQDGFLFVRRDLDEAKSSEQENSFNSQQCVTDFMHIATFRSKRIEQYAIIASHWLQHVRGVDQRRHKEGRHL